MNHQTTKVEIMSEDFTTPANTTELQELIDASIIEYEEMPDRTRQTKLFREKINLLITEYNDRREFKCYNTLK